jgi:type I restriction enzyme S subunit
MSSEHKAIRFGDLLASEGTRNGIYKSKEFHGRGAKIVNMGELFAFPRLFNVEMKRVDIDSGEEGKFSLKAGDLLFARRSLVAEGAGKCSIVKEVEGVTVFESSIIRARVDATKADSEYLYYTFSSVVGRNLLGTILRQTAVSGITGTDLVELEIPLPPVAEQKAIAHILGTLDDKIQLNRKTNETLEAMAKALFKSWFADFDPVRAKAEGRPTGLPAEISDLFPDSFEDSELGEIPSGWEVGGLEEFLVLQRGFDLPAPQRIKGAYPVVAASGVSGNHNEPMAFAPGVVTGRSGVLGKVFYIQTDFFPLNTTLWAKEFRLATPIYGYFLLCDIDFAVFNAGSAVPTLNRNHLGSLRFPLPPKALVVSFTEVAVDLMKRKEGIVAETSNLSATRDALLPKLISGEIRIPDAEKMLEEVGI